MSAEDKLQQNIRRAAGLHALRQINAIVDKEDKSDAAKALILRWLLRYSWILMLGFGVLCAYLTGVY